MKKGLLFITLLLFSLHSFHSFAQSSDEERAYQEGYERAREEARRDQERQQEEDNREQSEEDAYQEGYERGKEEARREQERQEREAAQRQEEERRAARERAYQEGYERGKEEARREQEQQRQEQERAQSAEDAYRQGYERGREEAKREAERKRESQDESQDESYQRGYADGKAAAQREEEAKKEQDAVEEAYRRGYRDGVNDSQKSEEKDESTASDANRRRPQSRDESRGSGTSTKKVASQPQVQVSFNYIGLFAFNNQKLNIREHDWVSRHTNFGLTFFLSQGFGITMEVGGGYATGTRTLNFNKDENSYQKTAKMVENSIDANLLLHFRRNLGSYFALTTDAGWFYNYTIFGKIYNLNTDEMSYLRANDPFKNLYHNHGPMLRLGVEIGNVESSGLYLPVGYAMQYSITRFEVQHGFYAGLGLKF